MPLPANEVIIVISQDVEHERLDKQFQLDQIMSTVSALAWYQNL